MKLNNLILVSFSRDEFQEMLNESIALALDSTRKDVNTNTEVNIEKYVYGLKGIADLFGVSSRTALKYKQTFLKEAVIQNGRTIMVDRALAIKLFNEHGRVRK